MDSNNPYTNRSFYKCRAFNLYPGIVMHLCWHLGWVLVGYVERKVVDNNKRRTDNNLYVLV